MLTKPPFNPKRDREKTIQIMFEDFSVTSYSVSVGAVLSLYPSGTTTGVVVDCGGGGSHTVPIYNGHAIDKAVRRWDNGGRDLTDYLFKALGKKGYDIATTADRSTVEIIKEAHCYVALDFDQELKVAAQDKSLEVSVGVGVAWPEPDDMVVVVVGIIKTAVLTPTHT
ncbi:actin [Akanthomyces lecanii RCEF 1005]|uniref:Actin n=1 Tax=Akanthomyces lecanii RCEF 1005 TaxID=1081108 RepID=A0A168B043_CORDF|nr:actin [Akanthomyces lecanii RCEF 1005]